VFIKIRLTTFESYFKEKCLTLDSKKIKMTRSRINSILTFLFLVFSLQAIAQSPYELTLKKDAPILTFGLAGGFASVFYDFNIKPLDEEDVAERIANPFDINSFDRKAVNFYSSKARRNSDVLLYTTYSYPFLFLLDKNIRSDYLTVGVMTIEVFLINGSLTASTKGFVQRARPFVYNTDVAIEEKLRKNAKLSFYSGHTSVVSSLSFFSARVFSDYHPNSKWKPAVWSAAAIIPAATGYFRVKGGKHFPTDVITGYITGALIGYFIPVLHRKKDKDQKVGVNIYPGPTSLGMTMTW